MRKVTTCIWETTVSGSLKKTNAGKRATWGKMHRKKFIQSLYVVTWDFNKLTGKNER